MPINENRKQHEEWFDYAVEWNRTHPDMVLTHMVVYKLGDSDNRICCNSREEAKAYVDDDAWDVVAVYNLLTNKNIQLNVKGVWNL